MQFKFNYIFAILGFICSIYAFYISSVLSIFSSAIGIVGLIVLILGIIGLFGIYLSFNQKYKEASIVYVIVGVLIILLLFIDAALFACIFYVLAGIVAYIEGKRDLSNPSMASNPNQQHYFGENNYQEQQQYPTNQSPERFDKRILIIPVVAVIIIILLFALSSQTSNEPTLNISNINIKSQGYSMYQISCDMIPNKEYTYLGLVVVFYDSNGAEIGKSPLVWNINNPTKGQLYKVSGTALTNNEKYKPARAEILFFDKSFNSNPSEAIYAQNITIDYK